MTAIRSVVLGCGSYLPQQILTNAELAERIDTSDEWIVQRTGIKQRHIAAEGEFTSHLAINAARAALADAGIDAQSIDLIVLATSTPDNTFPATAVAVQNALGINHGAAFDLQAVCSGFVFALATADNFLRSGACCFLDEVHILLAHFHYRTGCCRLPGGLRTHVRIAPNPRIDLGANGSDNAEAASHDRSRRD